MSRDEIECHTHGKAFQAFICEHLFQNPAQTWFSAWAEKENPWPDAWCGQCHQAFLREGEWNDKSEAELKIKLICHRCYEAKSADVQRVEV